MAPTTNRTCGAISRNDGPSVHERCPSSRIQPAVLDALRTAVDLLEPSHGGFIRVFRVAFVEAVEQLGSEPGTLGDR